MTEILSIPKAVLESRILYLMERATKLIPEATVNIQWDMKMQPIGGTQRPLLMSYAVKLISSDGTVICTKYI
jgi:hypothetical protein